MNYFILIPGLLAAAAMITGSVICAVDGLKRDSYPYDDMSERNLDITAITYGISGAALTGWFWYTIRDHILTPHQDYFGEPPYFTGWQTVFLIALGVLAAVVAALIFWFIGYWGGRGCYKMGGALRKVVLKSLSDDEQRSLAKILTSYILNGEVDRRLEDGVRFTLSEDGQRSLVKICSGYILKDEVLARLASNTLRLDAGQERRLAKKLTNSVVSDEAGQRLAEGELMGYDARSLIQKAAPKIQIAALCDLDLSGYELSEYEQKRLAEIVGLDQLIAMLLVLVETDLSDDELKKFGDLLGLEQLVELVLVQIDVLMEQSRTRLSEIGEQETLRRWKAAALDLRSLIVSYSTDEQ